MSSQRKPPDGRRSPEIAGFVSAMRRFPMIHCSARGSFRRCARALIALMRWFNDWEEDPQLLSNSAAVVGTNSTTTCAPRTDSTRRKRVGPTPHSGDAAGQVRLQASDRSTRISPRPESQAADQRFVQPSIPGWPQRPVGVCGVTPRTHVVPTALRRMSTGPERQARFMALVVVARRSQVKPDDVADLLDEQRVLRELERLCTMRLQRKGTPDTAHAALAQPTSLGHGASAPMVASRGVVSRVLARIFSMRSSRMRRGAPGLGSSNKPSNRLAKKRARHLPTVCDVT